MTFQEFIEFGLQLSILVTGVVEALKYGFLKAWFQQLQGRYNWTNQEATNWYVRFMTVISVATGILVATAAGEKANILVHLGFPNVAPVFGILATGVLVAFGNQFWHVTLDYLKTGVDIGKVYRDKLSQDVYENTPQNALKPPEIK
jgi:hypothetical protein